jgi:hypothetical protein
MLWEGVSFDLQGCVQSLTLTKRSLALPATHVFPEAVAFLSNVVFLDLSHNTLGGELPAEVFLLAHLEYLYLDHNQFRGHIPIELGVLDGLKTLNLAGNQLSGPLAPSLSSLGALEVLDLSCNALEGESGCYVHSLREWSGLYTPLACCCIAQGLSFSVSFFMFFVCAGTIPQELCLFSRMRVFNISSNNLTGA